MKKVLLLCAKGFEMMEFSPFVDAFGWAKNDFGYDVQVVTCGFTKTVVSAFGIPILVDHLIDDIDVNDYDAFAIPGGFEEYGFYEEAYDQKVVDLIQSFHQQNKMIASVCVGALPIGNSGILQGKKGTTYHLNHGHRQKQLAQFGVHIVNERIVEDDHIITSYCPETAPDVAFELLGHLI